MESESKEASPGYNKKTKLQVKYGLPKVIYIPSAPEV